MPLLAALLLSLLLHSAVGAGPLPAVGAQPCSRRGLCRRLAQADDATPEVVSANAAHVDGSGGISSTSPQAWPVPAGFRPFQHSVVRVVGRSVVQKRRQMEAGWRTYIEEEVETQGGREIATYRHANFTEHPSSDSDLAALEAVDEELVLYSSPAANAQPWTNATAAERAAAEAGIVSQIRARGLDVRLLQLYVGPLLPDSQPSAQDSNTSVVATTRSKLLISGEDLVPETVEVQTALLLALRDAAADARLPLLAANLTSWYAAPAADVERLNLTTPGLIEAEVWTQTPASGFQPSTFWQKVGPLMPETSAAVGVPMRIWFVSAHTIYTMPDGSRVGRANDPAQPGDQATPFSPGYTGQRSNGHVTAGTVAVIAVLSAGVVLFASLVGCTVWLLVRRHRRRRRRTADRRQATELAVHTPGCPLHVCTCHAAKPPRSPTDRLVHPPSSGPLPPALMLGSGGASRGSADSSASSGALTGSGLLAGTGSAAGSGNGGSGPLVGYNSAGIGGGGNGYTGTAVGRQSLENAPKPEPLAGESAAGAAVSNQHGA